MMFTVENRFYVSGRGTAVFLVERTGFRFMQILNARWQKPDETYGEDTAYTEAARVTGGEVLVFLLPKAVVTDLPVGSLIELTPRE